MTVQGLSSISDYYEELLEKKAAESGSSAAGSLTGSDSTETTLITDVAEISEDANSLYQYLTQKTTTDSVESTATQTSSSGDTVITSSGGDVVEISSEASQAAQALLNSSGETGSANGASSSETEDLSQYTEAQLKSMLEEGSISQSEYNAEMAKREAEGLSVEEEASAQEESTSEQ